MSSHCSHLAVDDRVVFFWGGGGLVFLVLFKIYLGFGPTAYWPCNLITLIGKTYFYCVQWYWPFWKRMGGFWRRIRKINIDIWIWNQVCGSEKLRTAKETFLSQNSIVLLYKTWWFNISIIKTFRYVRGCSQTTFTRFVLYWPPTILRLHFLCYKSLQKVDFFDRLPPSSCKRS